MTDIKKGIRFLNIEIEKLVEKRDKLAEKIRELRHINQVLFTVIGEEGIEKLVEKRDKLAEKIRELRHIKQILFMVIGEEGIHSYGEVRRMTDIKKGIRFLNIEIEKLVEKRDKLAEKIRELRHIKQIFTLLLHPLGTQDQSTLITDWI